MSKSLDVRNDEKDLFCASILAMSFKDGRDEAWANWRGGFHTPQKAAKTPPKRSMRTYGVHGVAPEAVEQSLSAHPELFLKPRPDRRGTISSVIRVILR